MTNASPLNRFFWLAALMIGGGVSYLIPDKDEPEQREAVTLKSISQKHMAPPLISSSMAEVEQTPIAQTDKQDQTNDDDPIFNKSPSTTHSRLFYDRFLKAKTIGEKMDNLHWAHAYFSASPDPSSIEMTAKALGLQKSDLIALITNTALDLFKTADNPPNGSRYEQHQFWNDLRFSYRYAGITDTGDYSESLAYARTGYTFDQLLRARNSYSVSASTEIIADVRTTAGNLQDTYQNHRDNKVAYAKAWELTLDSMILEDQIALRNKLMVITQFVSGSPDETERSDRATLLNLDASTYSNMSRLASAVQKAINRNLENLAKEYEQAPQRAITQTDTEASYGQPSLPDIIPLLNSMPAFK